MIIKSIDEVRQQVALWKQAGQRVALVPTMGHLHTGHLSLIEAVDEPDTRVVVSIFVNPMQFGENEDFGSYPRTFDEDIAKLSKYNVDVVFAPDTADIYPDKLEDTTIVDVLKFSKIVEGECRPQFFSGVATVVNKLFNIVQPDVAAFGEKDFQQLLVVRQMVSDLAMPVEIRSVATKREVDGLAMSSRNSYLDDEKRVLAAALYRSLQHAVQLIVDGGNPNYEVGHVSQALDELGFLVDYVVVRRQSDLGLPEEGDRALVLLAAARLGSVRLIDNIPFMLTE